MTANWFNVDKAGLAAVLERRGKSFAIFELVQNAWDSGTDRVRVHLTPTPGQPTALLTVEDWGDGFADLDDSFTMFSRSRRAGDPTKRGRFSLGEKLVLAVCQNASIVSTNGTMVFTGDGRSRRSAGRERGTLFTATIKMTRDEYEEVSRDMYRLIPPVETTFNGDTLERPKVITACVSKLPTELADEEGQLRKSVRETTLMIYEGSGDGRGEILEMGIPVVEIDAPYRVNVMQKVPLNMDRDSVTPAFRRKVEALVLNQVAELLTPEEAAEPWAQEAAGDALATPEAVKAVITARFGERAVVATPGDPIANANAEAAGFTVVPGGALPGSVWSNVRKFDVLKPTSQVFPSPRPESLAAAAANATVCPTCGRIN